MKAVISSKSFNSKDALFEIMKAFISIKSLSSKDVILVYKWLGFKTILRTQFVVLNYKGFYCNQNSFEIKDFIRIKCNQSFDFNKKL